MLSCGAGSRVGRSLMAGISASYLPPKQPKGFILLCMDNDPVLHVRGEAETPTILFSYHMNRYPMHLLR